MDGNGRWARNRKRYRWHGHLRGAQRVIEMVRHVSKNTNVKVLTIWGYSTDNEKRSNVVEGGVNEVEVLTRIFYRFIVRRTPEINLKNIRVTIIGDLSRLPSNVQRVANKLIDVTKDNNGLHLQVALGYGGNDEAVRMVRGIVADALADRLTPADITEELIASYLDTASVPDPDVIIRTSGEKRLSGFLPLQSKYSELVFVDALWPDFTPKHLEEVLNEYAERDRRYGGVALQSVAR